MGEGGKGGGTLCVEHSVRFADGRQGQCRAHPSHLCPATPTGRNRNGMTAVRASRGLSYCSTASEHGVWV